MNEYPTNLTDKQWQVIEKIVDQQHRRRKHYLITIINAILYLNKTGSKKLFKFYKSRMHLMGVPLTLVAEADPRIVP